MERADRIGLDPGRLLQRLPGCTVMGNFQPIAPDCRDFQHRRRQLLIHAEHVGQRVPRYVDAAPRAEPAGIPRQIPAGRHGVDIRIAAAGTEHRTLDRANGRKIHIVEGNRRIDFHVEPGSSACRDRAAVQPERIDIERRPVDLVLGDPQGDRSLLIRQTNGDIRFRRIGCSRKPVDGLTRAISARIPALPGDKIARIKSGTEPYGSVRPALIQRHFLKFGFIGLEEIVDILYAISRGKRLEKMCPGR